ncbi:MAG: hypothetical protein ACE5H4_15390 [Candidatus Thorarchaeota archaeon]
MQSPDVELITNVRILLFFMLLLLIYLSTKQSSKSIDKAWRLPIVYPYENDESARIAKERESLLRKLSMRWNLFTLIDYSLGVLLIYELALGFSAAEAGVAYYFGVHMMTALLLSVGIGTALALVVIGFRSPFRLGKIEPLKHLLNNLESLVNAAQSGDVTVVEDTQDILLRIVGKEIERFIGFREMSDAESGRLLEYLSNLEGAVSQAASALLWPR